MFCRNCGNEIEEKDNFCAKCGNQINDGNTDETIQKPQTEKKLRRNIKASLTLIILIVVLAGCGIMAFRFSALFKADRQIDLGYQYLDGMEYEQAVAAFETAIEIDPMNPDAYLGLADAYIRLGEPDMAQEILQEGFVLIQDENLQEKIYEVNELTEASGTKREDYKQEQKEQEQQEQIINSVFLLEEYASQLSCLKGKEYASYLLKVNTDYPYEYDFTEIPVSNIGYHIKDFDRDGESELLTVGITEHYYFNVCMYEVIDGQVVLADEWDLESYDIPAPMMLISEGNINCYLYGTEQICIGIEVSDLASLIADGVKLTFLSISYIDGSFHENGFADYEGSDGLYDEAYMNILTSLGIDASWEDMFFEGKHVYDYIGDYDEIAAVTVTNVIGFEEMWDWQSSGSDRIHISDIYFKSTDD